MVAAVVAASLVKFSLELGNEQYSNAQGVLNSPPPTGQQATGRPVRDLNRSASDWPTGQVR